MKIATLADLYLDQLQDMHSCERQIIKALPKLSKSIESPKLLEAATHHLGETKEQLERLTQILDNLGKTPGRKVCEATVGLLAEATELAESAVEPAVRDAALIAAMQKLEHYEIASYGCLRSFATLLGRSADAKLIQKSLSEESKADATLCALATSGINAGAMGAGLVASDAE